MKLFKTLSATITFHLLFFLSVFGQGTNVDWATVLQIERTTPTAYSKVPAFATFYSAQHSPISAQPWPPLPSNRYGFSAWYLWGNVWLLDDKGFDYNAASTQVKQSMATDSGSPIPSGPTEPDYGSNLWLQLSNTVAGNSDVAYFYLHNTTNALFYCVWAKNDLNNPIWTPLTLTYGPPRGDDGTLLYQDSYSDSFSFPLPGPNVFMWANGSSNLVRITPDASTQTVTYPSSSTDSSQNLTYDVYAYDAYYHYSSVLSFYVSGSAVFGVDYTVSGMTYSNGIARFPMPSGTPDPTTFVFSPIYTTNATYAKSVTLQLTPFGCAPFENSYFETVNILPETIPFTVVTNLGNMSYLDGIGYNPVTNALIASANSGPAYGEPFNFVSIATNNSGGITINTNYSPVAGLPDEVELTIVQATTNGFTKGDMYFGDAVDGAAIDKLSVGDTWTQDWCFLTNAAPVGGLCIDQSGAFGGSLIAVTGDNKVYSISSNGAPTLLTTIASAAGLTGAIVLPNDATKWGPWAGKILTSDPNNQILYTVDTNGAAASFQTTNYLNGVAPESFALIPPNQNLYFLDAGGGNLDEISATNLAPYVGDLSISSGGTSSSYPEGNNYYPLADIFIVRWNPTNSDFDVRGIPGVYSSIYEDATFAPFDLSSQ